MSDTNYVGDLHTLETFDGLLLYAPEGLQCFVTYGGYGAPPIEYLTRRGYLQDGSTVIDYALGDRTLSLQFYRNGDFCSRADYWAFRQQLHEYLRPNRGGPIKLTLRQGLNGNRSIYVRPNPGAVFAPFQAGGDSWGINEPLEFIAHDPVWFDPDQNTCEGSVTTSAHLVFPFGFGGNDNGARFGFTGNRFTCTITYPGSWREYPVLILTGGYQIATIEHIELNIMIQLTVSIADGEQRIITLTPGSQSIVDGNGDNKFGELSPSSNLTDFALLPVGEISGGVNTIRVTLTAPTAQTNFEMQYYTRYFGI